MLRSVYMQRFRQSHHQSLTLYHWWQTLWWAKWALQNITNNEQWRIYIVKFWTPPGSKFFQFHAVFWRKFGKIVWWRTPPPPQDWRPHLGSTTGECHSGKLFYINESTEWGGGGQSVLYYYTDLITTMRIAYLIGKTSFVQRHPNFFPIFGVIQALKATN